MSRTEVMMFHPLIRTSLVLGLTIGLVFGLVNLVLSWLFPLSDDSPGALLRFYGPMFCAWAVVAFRAARHDRRVATGVVAGVLVAFATFCLYNALALLRVNLFLHELTARADWQDLVTRFRNSDAEDLRLFVNLDYIKALPLKTGVASLIGGLMGVIGGCASRVIYTEPRRREHPRD